VRARIPSEDEMGTQDTMKVEINHSARIELSPVTFASLHTYFYGGNYRWAGTVMEIVGKDNLGLNVYKIVGNGLRSDPLKFWLTPDEAIADAIAQFYSDEDNGNSSSVEPSYPEDAGLDFTLDDDRLMPQVGYDYSGPDTVPAKLWGKGLYGN
jgi:hypothetical protein